MKKRQKGNIALLILGMLLVLVVGGIYLYNKNIAKTPTSQIGESQGEKNSSTTQTSESPNATVSPNFQSTVKDSKASDYSPGTFSSGEEDMGLDISVVGVDFDGSVFTPNLVNIKTGDYVFFKNTSANAFTLVSEGLRINESVASKATYKMQFIKAGNFVFTNGVRGSIGVDVVVAQ